VRHKQSVYLLLMYRCLYLLLHYVRRLVEDKSNIVGARGRALWIANGFLHSGIDELVRRHTQGSDAPWYDVESAI